MEGEEDEITDVTCTYMKNLSCVSLTSASHTELATLYV
jgi:hypothetical protein